MTIGLISFHFAHHYGAQLQACALSRVLGAEIIDYRLPSTEKASSLFQSGLSNLPRNAHTLAHYAPLKRRHERFNAFVSETMRLSSKRYSDYAGLCADVPRYDRYVCGSDQIWNPFIFEDRRFDPSFFLAFIKDKPLMAYAPSFGAATIPDAMRGELKDYLSAFKYLSAREKRGADIIKDVSGLTAQVTLDPTLLFTGDEWAGLASKERPKTPYTLCYFVSDPMELGAYAAQTGRRVVQLAGRRRRVEGADELVLDAGPREFLSLFQNADFVLTNSFHGAVFSILFNRPFMCGAGMGETAAGSRIGGLLGMLGLDRQLTQSALHTPIDYASVNALLQAEREKSLAFIRQLDGGVPC